MSRFEECIVDMPKKQKKELQGEAQVSLTFRYYEHIRSQVEDFERLEKLIPSESSRSACYVMDHDKSDDKNAAYVIEARKNDLLGYFQTVFRDHIYWGKRLIEEGWEIKTIPKTTQRGRRR